MSNKALRRLSVRSTVFGAVVFALIAVTAGAAWAAFTDNIYPTTYQTAPCRDESGPDGRVTCLTDNATLTYYMDSAGTNELEGEDRRVVIDVMSDIYAPTDFSVSLDTSPEFSGSAETDIVYEESGIGVPSGSSGVTFCNDAVSDLRCDQQYIRILGGGHYVQGLTCHETGHAVGLQHGNKSDPLVANTDERLGCMETPTSDGEVLQDNQIDNINGTY
ncbi:hypothetical protein [Glycomyces rhizosphaerae]|uniref:Matrixin n=1 Tax=Glycomyces rhizosphaerae TaxID=2054422 RepID=A0ABV7Q1J9_9ACTN